MRKTSITLLVVVVGLSLVSACAYAYLLQTADAMVPVQTLVTVEVPLDLPQ